MQEAGLKLTRLDVGPAPASETHRAWEFALSASAVPASGGAGIQDRQPPGATAGNLGPSGGFEQGGSGTRGEHPAGGRAGNGQEGTGLRLEGRSEKGEAGPRARGSRGTAAIDAWA